MNSCLLCLRFRQSRGLCRSCYNKSLRRVQSGAATWAELESLGQASPPTPEGRQRWLEAGRRAGK